MTNQARTLVAAVLLLLAPLASVPVGAAEPQRPATVVPEGLPAQDKEMLTLALEVSRRCSDTREKWVAAKEVSEDRLFSFLYYPMPNTDPPKFTTDYDKLSDRDILPIEEGALAKSSALAFVVLVDRFGYLPTHNQRYSQPLTGNAAADLVNNRTKRIFNDRTGLAAARSEAPFLIQRYQRDTGEAMIDLSVPVYVHGTHWGAVRIGYRLVEAK